MIRSEEQISENSLVVDLPEHATVGDLIKALKKFDKNMKVFDMYDGITKVYYGITYDYYQKEIKVVRIE